MCFHLTGALDLDSIRLSTYRTACKLRFIQKRCNCKFEVVYCKRFYCNITLISVFYTNILIATLFSIHSSFSLWKWCISRYCHLFFASCSAFDGYLEYYRGVPGKQTQLHGPQHRVLSVKFASNTVHHLLPAEQALAHNPPDQCRPVYLVSPQLPASSLRPVRNPDWIICRVTLNLSSITFI